MFGCGSPPTTGSPSELLPSGLRWLRPLRHPGAGSASAAGGLCGRTGEDQTSLEEVQSQRGLRRFLLGGDFISWWLQVTARLGSATETRTEVQKTLRTLRPGHQRLQEPDSYTVSPVHTQAHVHTLPGIHSSVVGETSLTLGRSFPPPGGAVAEASAAADRVSHSQLQQLPRGQLAV